MVRRTLLSVLTLLFLCSHLLAQPLKIQEKDLLGVQVVGFPDYSVQVRVAEDGSISGVGFGRVEAAGKTLEQVDAIITERLRDYIRDPQVFVSLVEQAEESVFVVGGQVENGRVPYDQGLDLRQVLAAATLPDEPENVQVEVFRQGRSLETLNAEDVLGGEDVWTGPLRPGDVVVVSRVSTVKVWISTGFALPGEAEIYRDATLGKAVALGGGIAYPEARNIEERLLMQEGTNFIIRRGDRTISVPVTEEGSSLDTPLEPGDTITVKFPKVAQVLVAGQVTLPGTQVMRPGASVLEAISKARGIEDEGSLREVFVFRDGTTRRLDLSQPELGRELERVEDGDLIYVGRNERYALVLGTVTVPGKVLFPDDREEFRVTDALAEARGLDRTGTLRRVVLLRTNEEGVYEAQEFNLDEYVKDGREEANPVLQPGDVVLFGKPRGLTLANASQILSSALLLENLLGD